jgi:hypothetical protein
MNNQLKIPQALHELFGEEQIKSELMITIGFTVVSFLALIVGTQEEWIGLQWYKTLLLFILLLDILGGVAANLSAGTNLYYMKNPKKRRIFISIHIQPFVFAWILQSDFIAAFIVWAYTIGSSTIINLLQGKECQRILAGSLLGFGILVFALLNFDLPKVITIIYMLYMFKLIYGFAVDHSKV